MTHVHGFLKVEFLKKKPIPDDVGEKLRFANNLANFGIMLQKYQEMYDTENEERLGIILFLQWPILLYCITLRFYIQRSSRRPYFKRSLTLTLNKWRFNLIFVSSSFLKSWKVSAGP